MATMAERVFALRSKGGLTQAQLAKKVGVTQQAIDNLEKGLTKKPSFLAELAGVFGVAPQYILEGRVTTPPPIDRPFLTRCFDAVVSVETDNELSLTNEDRVNLASELYLRHYQADEKALVGEAQRLVIRFLAKTFD